jgi:hypothetical protein
MAIFWHLGSVTRWNYQFLIHTWTFLAIIFVASQLFLCFFSISLWLRIGVYNIHASKNCVKLLKPPKIQIPTANTSLLDLLPHSWFHSMLFALPRYPSPYCILSWIGVSTLLPSHFTQIWNNLEHKSCAEGASIYYQATLTAHPANLNWHPQRRHVQLMMETSFCQHGN